MKIKALLFIFAILSILLMVMQVKSIQKEKRLENIIVQNNKAIKNADEQRVKETAYLKEKGVLINFLSKKEPLSVMDVFFRSYKDFNVFDFERMEILNFTIQPYVLSKQISKDYLDIEFFKTELYEPIEVASKIKFQKNKFSKNYTNNYEGKSDCDGSFYVEVAFILTLLFNENSQLIIKESKREDYVMWGFNKCGSVT